MPQSHAMCGAPVDLLMRRLSIHELTGVTERSTNVSIALLKCHDVALAGALATVRKLLARTARSVEPMDAALRIYR